MIYNENQPNSFNTTGAFNRSLKVVLGKHKSEIKNITTCTLRENNRRKTFVILTSSDKIISDMLSDITYSDIKLYPALITDINDSRIQFLRITAPSKSPTTIPCTITPSQSSLFHTEPLVTTSPTLVKQTVPIQLLLPTTLILPTTPTTDTFPIVNSKYSLLSSLGINTNFDTEENETKLRNLLAELIALHKSNNKELNFTHLGNSKPGVLIQIPKASTYDSYNRNERRNHWLEKSLNFIANHSNNKSSFEEVTSWLLRDVHKKYPTTFLKVATDLGLHVVQTMNSIEAAAMWTEANVPIRVARIILSHLHKKFKNRVQVPFSQINMLSCISNKLNTVFDSFLYQKITNSSEKSKEKIEFWTYAISDLLELDFERLLLTENVPKSGFGYTSKAFGDKKGVIIIIGSDHGGGKSRFLIRTNYLDSKSRRNVNKVDYGTRTIQFAEVNCKKDVHEVHAKISPDINEAIKKLESSMLVSVGYSKKYLKCIFIPNIATDVRTVMDSLNIHVEYCVNGEIERKVLNVDKEYQHLIPEINKVIPMMKVVVAGDLSYFATCTGRDGHSHCRCPYCDLTPSAWSNAYVTPHLITLKQLHEYADIHQHSRKKNDDTKGVIMAPLLEIEPSYYIVPILHLLIGIVNKEWTSMVHFFDEFVENVSDIEATLKDTKLEFEIIIDELKDDIEVLTVNRNMACLEKETSNEADICYKQSIKDLKKLNESKKEKTSELRNINSKLKVEQQKRLNDEEGMENLLYNILEDSHIQKQHFHGGAMNGVCCRRLLDNLDIIFPKIRKIASERLALNKNRDIEQDMKTLTSVINKFQALFETTDVVFLHLRILDPTDEEIEVLRKGIKVLEKLWCEMDLVITPKVHILFIHAMVQVHHFGGIADLVEDFIEKSYQIGKKLDHLVARMSSQGFCKQELVKIRRQWLSNDPAVLQQLATVQQSRKRNSKHSPSIKITKSMIARDTKRVKRERVQLTFDGH